MIFLIGLLLTLNVSAQDSRHYPPFGFYAVAGQIKGVSLARILGENEDVDSLTVPEDVIYAGGVYPWPASAQATTIVSTSTNDTAAGTGCRAVRVTGLNSSYELTTEDVALNGTTPVNLSTNFLRVNNSLCISSGTGQVNAGDIDVKHSTDILSRIDDGNGQSQDAIYTVPVGYKLFVDNFICNVSRSGSGTAIVYAFVKPFATNTWTAVSEFALITQGSSTSNQSPPSGRYFVVAAKSDIKLTVTSVDANNLGFNCSVAGFLIKDDSVIY